jgi:hypothetical protein
MRGATTSNGADGINVLTQLFKDGNESTFLEHAVVNDFLGL